MADYVVIVDEYNSKLAASIATASMTAAASSAVDAMGSEHAAQDAEEVATNAAIAVGATTLGNYLMTLKLADVITKGPWVDVRAFGAVGDGSADDTTALQAALDYAGTHKLNVIIAGDYIASNLTVPSNCGITFLGGSITQKTEATGDLVLLSGTENSVITNPVLVGKGPAAYDTDSLIGDCIGLHLLSARNCHVVNPRISYFDYSGLQIDTGSVVTNSIHGQNCSVVGGQLHHNYANLVVGRWGEYSPIVGVTCTKGFIGVLIDSGNVYCSGVISTDNIDGCVLVSNVNDGHGIFSGCSFNHNSRYALKAIDINNGHTFAGCHFYYGDIYLMRCRGIRISGGHIGSNTFLLEGGGVNHIIDNDINGAITITHGYNSQPDYTIFAQNRDMDNYGGSTMATNGPLTYLNLLGLTAITGLTSLQTIKFAATNRLICGREQATLYDTSTGIGTLPFHSFYNFNGSLHIVNAGGSAVTFTASLDTVAPSAKNIWVESFSVPAGATIIRAFSAGIDLVAGTTFELTASATGAVNVATANSKLIVATVSY